ncbi:hypothetical protein C1J03_07440 [Sulfitobacter sp. SK012]|uniref:tyrosine-type recombinase/integrase n=1 Tax=Sulfitobacter sp. SK012 TaxID=1389005 RepID=UPI000E0AB058|nr:integrase arm-type DNA-binding domain-containing protein [Sulfitobacter sp. SK012]AXI45877.1 hypothetical protein C1J03_07440 [Sulfitobacter sp. SK012]
MALTELKIRKCKPNAKPYKLSDGENLVLVVRPTGSKTWKQRIYQNGKERDVTLGSYPSLTLADARRAASEVRDAVASGIDPGAEKRRAQARDRVVAGDAFRDVAVAYEATRTSWVPSVRARFWHRMNIDVFPVLGNTPIDGIEPLDILAAVQPIADRGAVYTAKKVIGFIAQVMDHAVVLGMCKYNPALRLGKAIGDTPAVSHRPALIEPEKLALFLQSLWGLETRAMGKPIVQACLYTFARPGEVRQMRWADLNFEKREWVYRVGKVAKDGHIVPLSDPMLALIDQLRVRNSSSEHVFAGPTGRVVADVATGQLIDRLGYKGRMTAHGARAVARTVLVETLGYRESMVEMQLSHTPRDMHGRAYNRVTWRSERHEMMRTWADWLDGVRVEASVLPMAAEYRQGR